MRFLILILLAAVALSCKKVTCVDCADNAGNVFTFCDPAEPAFDSLQCGETYTEVK